MDNANFRFYRNNKGCSACLDEARRSTLQSTSDLFWSVVSESKCEECYIYNMWKDHRNLWKDYKNILERYVDDGK